MADTMIKSDLLLTRQRPVLRSFQQTPRTQNSKAHFRSNLLVVCALTDKGRCVNAEDIQVRTRMGEGSYGQVFEGYLDGQAGRQRVILKRVKDKVEGAAEMGQMEHLLNVYASKAAKHSIANFVGYAQVSEGHATKSLTEGLWLLWQYEGSKTLCHYLRRRDCIQRLSQDLQVSEDTVVPTVLQQIFESLSGLHSAGLVHRDVKPLNIIFAEELRRFKLIDLGACADLRTGTNYIPDESILDPVYAPPEQYCMPTDSPHLAKQLRPVAVAMSPVLWSRFKPDRFDSYSCGLILLQLAIPKLRVSANIKTFNTQLKKFKYDLMAWRNSEGLSAKETAVLDANSGAGWNLAAGLLRPRDIKAVSTSQKALKQGTGSSKRRLVTVPAQEPAKEEGSGLMTSALNFWKVANRKLADLEDKLLNQGQAVEYQTGQVALLQKKYESGQVSKQELAKQEGLLGKMTNRLNSLQTDFSSTAGNAQKVLNLLNPSAAQADALVSQQDRIARLRAEGNLKLKEANLQENPRGKMATGFGDFQGDFSSKASSPFNFFQRQSVAESPEAANETVAAEGGFFGSFIRGNSRQRQDQAALTRMESEGTGSRKGGRMPLSRGPARKIDLDNGTQSGSRSSKQLAPSLWDRVRRKPEKPQVETKVERQASLTDQATGAAVTGIYASLKFTGLALKVATDMATSLGKEAEQVIAANEAQRSEQRKVNSARKAFLDLLQDCPKIVPDSKWSYIRPVIRKDPRFGNDELSEETRANLFEEYTAELETVAEMDFNGGKETFKDVLDSIDLTRGSSWTTTRSRLEKDSRFRKLPAGLPVERLYAQAMKAQEPKFDFWDLLQECKDPEICPTSAWWQVRRQISGDQRFDAISEKERRAMFRKYVASLNELQESSTQSSSGTSLERPGKSGNGSKGNVKASMESLGTLQNLRAKQAQLKAEYDRMEAKLVEMERKLQRSASRDGRSRR